MPTPTAYLSSGAVISSCADYRYLLWRTWDDTKQPLVYIMLNPSTADADQDDPTIRKCVGFARRLGFGGIQVLNLFAYRATDPTTLKRARYPVGPDNDAVIYARLTALRLSEGGYVICAWGAHARGLVRARTIETNLALNKVQARALRLLPDGTPAHPLMLPYTCTPVPLERHDHGIERRNEK